MTTRHLITTLTALTIYLTALGQHDIGLKANFGLSYISSKIPTYGSTTTQKIYFQPSGQAGLFYNAHLSPKSLIGTELLFTQIEGKEEFSTPTTNNGIPTGEYIIEDIWRHISYFAIPLYYGYSMKKLTINIGGQISFMIHKSGRSEIQSPYPVFEINPTDKIAIGSYDFGLRAGLSYILSNKFAIEVTYYYGLHNVFKNPDNRDYKWNIQQLVVGLRYNFNSYAGQKTKTDGE